MSAQVVAVVGASGGVGASTVGALLARRRARGPGRVALVDLGSAGGGVEVLLGVEEQAGARWTGLRDVRGTLPSQDVQEVLPVWEGVEVLSGDREGGAPLDLPAVPALWRALVDGCGLVVADLGTSGAGSPAVRSLLAEAGARGALDVLVVTGQDVVGAAGAIAARAALDAVPGARFHLVLRRRRGARVSPVEAADVVGLPLVATVPTDRSLAGAVDRGLGPVTSPRGRLGVAVRRLDRVLPDLRGTAALPSLPDLRVVPDLPGAPGNRAPGDLPVSPVVPVWDPVPGDGLPHALERTRPRPTGVLRLAGQGGA
ncbi:CpaE-like family protein [Cellulomonas bogoriensis]|uniref:pilus assembly protein FlpE n=1 Tax=Cellulomonas bogoriensis TaxID=301388 RepID=UPI000B072133|nr:pilus assembly protein FlpE [Cellulomonas bogoriensis]